MCTLNDHPIYVPHSDVGISNCQSNSDGNIISIQWNRAYAHPYNLILAYNIYYSTDKQNVFSENPKYVSIGGATLAVDIDGFTPGDTFYFAVRATQWQSDWIDLNSLPDSGDSKVYPEGLLLQNVSQSDSVIYISDLDTFPNTGIVQIGDELVQYLNKDLVNNSISGLTRGFLDSNIRFHNTDGYDGYYFESPIVSIWKGLEEKNQKIFSEVCDFSYPKFPVTEADGYANREVDLINTDLSTSDSSLTTLPPYDFRGWRRINPADLLSGKCVGSYFGGEHFCADGYNGVGMVIRGSNVSEEAIKREEVLLETDAIPCLLVRRKWTGMYCTCYVANKEYADDRCPFCAGSGRVIGWEPFYNPRRSDGRILVRFDATVDDVPYMDGGLESTFAPAGWTLPTPTIHDRDMLITYDKFTDAEVFRYEVLNVTRNILFNQTVGAQKLSLVRVRKTDPFYRIDAIGNTADVPRIITTSIASVPGLILPHFHTFQIGPNIISPSQIFTTTSFNGAIVKQGHSHQIKGDGTTLESFSHTHTFTL